MTWGAATAVISLTCGTAMAVIYLTWEVVMAVISLIAPYLSSTLASYPEYAVNMQVMDNSQLLVSSQYGGAVQVLLATGQSLPVVLRQH